MLERFMLLGILLITFSRIEVKYELYLFINRFDQALQKKKFLSLLIKFYGFLDLL